MRINIEQEISTTDRTPVYEIHIREITPVEYDAIVSTLNRLLKPEEPPRKPQVRVPFEDTFEIVYKNGRWHVMSLEDGKSKGDFDNEASARNHLDYICEMREYHKRGGPL